MATVKILYALLLAAFVFGQAKGWPWLYGAAIAAMFLLGGWYLIAGASGIIPGKKPRGDGKPAGDARPTVTEKQGG